MKYHNLEKTEKITQAKAIFVTLAIHFSLLYGLIYMKSDKIQDIMPNFVKEWVNEGKVDEGLTTEIKRP